MSEVSDIGAERFAAALPKCDKLQRQGDEDSMR